MLLHSFGFSIECIDCAGSFGQLLGLNFSVISDRFAFGSDVRSLSSWCLNHRCSNIVLTGDSKTRYRSQEKHSLRRNWEGEIGMRLKGKVAIVTGGARGIARPTPWPSLKRARASLWPIFWIRKESKKPLKKKEGRPWLFTPMCLTREARRKWFKSASSGLEGLIS